MPLAPSRGWQHLLAAVLHREGLMLTIFLYHLSLYSLLCYLTMNDLPTHPTALYPYCYHTITGHVGVCLVRR
jgi:hypothetical protein